MEITSRFFEAQFGGTCGSCGEEFKAGRRVAYTSRNGVITEDCSTFVDEVPAQKSSELFEFLIGDVDDEHRSSTEGSGEERIQGLGPAEVAAARAAMCTLCFCVHAGECL